jgi:ketosteroid isomerase-like protein
MTMEPVQTVQRIYEAFGRGDVPAIIESLSDDVEWEHDSVDHGIPWLKPGRGKQHVLSFLGIVGTDLEIAKFDVRSLLAAERQVAAVIEIDALVRATNKRLHDLELHLWTFDAQGRVTRFRHVADTHQHWLATRP